MLRATTLIAVMKGFKPVSLRSLGSSTRGFFACLRIFSKGERVKNNLQRLQKIGYAKGGRSLRKGRPKRVNKNPMTESD